MNIIETVVSVLEDASFTEKAAALNALVDAVIEDSEKARKSMGRNICLVPIKTIKMFHEHPFYIDYDEDMEDLVRSITKYGQITPGAVRYAGEGNMSFCQVTGVYMHVGWQVLMNSCARCWICLMTMPAYI